LGIRFFVARIIALDRSAGRSTVWSEGFAYYGKGNVALRLLHRLGDRRIPLDSENAILTKSSETQNLILALWNYCDLEVEGEGKSFRIQLADPDAYKWEATIQVMDETHGNAVRRWNLMGGSQFPTREQISELQTAAMVPTRETISLGDVINLEPHALALIEIFHV